MSKHTFAEYPNNLDESKKAEWDARQLFVKELQDINEASNRVKMALELREGGKEDIAKNFMLYYSLLRWYYRNMRPLFKEEDIKKLDSDMEEIKAAVNGVLVGMRENNEYPARLEKEMEGIQNIMHEKRWSKGLVVPIGLGRDETGIAGWEG